MSAAGNCVENMFAKITWDRKGVVTKAIQDGYGYPPFVAEKLGMTEQEMWQKYSMFAKPIETAMRLERERVLRVWNSALNSAVLTWINEASGGVRFSDERLFESIRDHMLCILNGEIYINPKSANNNVLEEDNTE